MSTNKGEVRIEEPTRLQRSIARRAAESRATVPHLDASTEVQLVGTDDLLARVVQASALALRAVPKANASYRDGRFELYSRVNVGVAFPTDDAYLIPTVFDADAKAPEELRQLLDELGARTRNGELSPPELSGATFTVWPTGAHGGAPLIVPPQAAALGVGAPREAAVIRDGSVSPGLVLTVTLACDHRILYASHATDLLAAIASHLQETR